MAPTSGPLETLVRCLNAAVVTLEERLAYLEASIVTACVAAALIR